MQDHNSPEYHAKTQKLVDSMTKMTREAVDKNARVIQTKKAQKLLKKFGLKPF